MRSDINGNSAHNYDVLFTRIKQGDAKAYEIFFKAQYHTLYTYASSIVGETYAEEIVQDVMLSIWESRNNIIIQKSISHYLYGAIRYRCLTHLRRNQMMRGVHQFLYEEENSFLDETDILNAFELSDKITKAMDNLPHEYKEAFEMNRFQNLSYKEIAKKLNTTIKSVDYKIQKAVKILRNELKGYNRQ